MKTPSTADLIVDLVAQMRENSKEMYSWRNVALATECVKLLRQLDTPEDTPLVKARVCGVIVEQLPIYDVPRHVIDILRYQREQLLLSDEPDASPLLEEVDNDIRKMEDYIDTAHVSDSEFRERYGRHLKSDPIERTPLWEELYCEVQRECDRRLGDTPRGMGFCHAYWYTLSAVLAERGIQWRSPAVMNPRVMFD
jgi:hypothetical protein